MLINILLKKSGIPLPSHHFFTVSYPSSILSPSCTNQSTTPPSPLSVSQFETPSRILVQRSPSQLPILSKIPFQPRFFSLFQSSPNLAVRVFSISPRFFAPFRSTFSPNHANRSSKGSINGLTISTPTLNTVFMISQPSLSTLKTPVRPVRILEIRLVASSVFPSQFVNLSTKSLNPLVRFFRESASNTPNTSSKALLMVSAIILMSSKRP